MKLCIETINLTNEDDIFARSERQLRPLLLLLEGQVKSLKVRLEDVNGPTLGGVDKHCVMVVTPHSGATRMFDDVHADAQQALVLTMRHLERWVGACERQRRARQHLRFM